MSTIVTTQAELDAALAVGDADIIIDSPRGRWLKVSGSASVWAYDSATVRAYGSAYVRAYDAASVEASGSATVRASGSATVRATGSASVRAYGSATVEATPYVAIHKMSRDARITGGTVIDIPALDLTDMHVWADYHGTTIADGVVVVGDKVKARTVRVVREVTIDGEPIS